MDSRKRMSKQMSFHKVVVEGKKRSVKTLGAASEKRCRSRSNLFFH